MSNQAIDNSGSDAGEEPTFTADERYDRLFVRSLSIAATVDWRDCG